MPTLSVVGKEGMISIPKPIREKAGLEEGGKIAIDLKEEGEITLKKVADVRTVRGTWKDKEEIIEAIGGLKNHWAAWTRI